MISLRITLNQSYTFQSGYRKVYSITEIFSQITLFSIAKRFHFEKDFVSSHQKSKDRKTIKGLLSDDQIQFSNIFAFMNQFLSAKHLGENDISIKVNIYQEQFEECIIPNHFYRCCISIKINEKTKKQQEATRNNKNISTQHPLLLSSFISIKSFL